MLLASRISHRRHRSRSELARHGGLLQAIGGSDYGSRPQGGSGCSRHGLTGPPGPPGARETRTVENRHGGILVNCEFLHVHRLATCVEVHGCQAQCALVVGPSFRSRCVAHFASNRHALGPRASRNRPEPNVMASWGLALARSHQRLLPRCEQPSSRKPDHRDGKTQPLA